MNYQRIYNQLIAKAQARSNLEGYVEKHHIVPKALGGTDDKANLVDLTAREHFIAHMLLAKVHGGTMWYAVIRMKGNSTTYVNSRLYEIARKEASKLPAWNKGKCLSASHKQSLKLAHTGRQWSDLQREAFSSIEVKEKHSLAIKLKMADPKVKEKHRKAVSAAKKGKLQSDAHKLATSIAVKAWWAERKQKGAYVSVS